MKVQLIDVDSVMPNLALMKISSYHKHLRDSVYLKRYCGWNIPLINCIPDPDITYISKMFTFSQIPYDDVPNSHTTFLGGIGLNNSQLPFPEMNNAFPDYDLYPSTYSLGRTTYGCFRHCYFCKVPSHEGKLIQSQHPKEFHSDRFDTMNLLDNNWLGLKDWFLETSQWIIDKKIKLIENGLDIRLFDNDIVSQLVKIKFLKGMKIAFDSQNYKSNLIKGIELLQHHGFDTRNKLICYCYLHDNSLESFYDLLERIELLREMKTSPFVMFNCENVANRRTNAIKRYVNKHQFFWKISFEDYCKHAYAKPLDIMSDSYE